MLLFFEAAVSILINCLIVTVSTDQLDYISCWTHSLWRQPGACDVGNVAMGTRFFIAVAAEHVLVFTVFLIHSVVPDQPGALTTKLKRAALLFQKRY